MKFDFVIGNPPYQEEAPGESTSDKPLYHEFMDSCYEVASCVELITPGRFLFNAGATPKSWNKKMLNDPHFKVIHYESDATKFFPNTAITGGIVISYRDKNKTFNPIGTFIQFDELNSIKEKVTSDVNFHSLSEIVSGRTPYLFTDEFHKDNPNVQSLLSKGHQFDISSNTIETLPDIFDSNPPINKKDYYRVLGRVNGKRVYRWINRKYARGRSNDLIGKWKIFLPKANGASGMLGSEPARLISKPQIGEPNDIATDTFIVVGPVKSEEEAHALLKYLYGKFSRALLGILKVTQLNARATWQYVPIQDFSADSDIDWSKSINEIDQQLYAKYNLTEDEIAFIESHVKEMK